MQTPANAKGFGRPWIALCVAFALHVLDEATTGFLPVYNATVIAARERWGWFPMPTFAYRRWLTLLIVGVVFCFALTPLASQGARRMRLFAWFLAILHFFNATGHTVATILGHTFPSVTFPRPALGFYSSPLLYIGSIWLIARLWQSSPGNSQHSAAAAR